MCVRECLSNVSVFRDEVFLFVFLLAVGSYDVYCVCEIERFRGLSDSDCEYYICRVLRLHGACKLRWHVSIRSEYYI